jgi:hypothetical protein
VGSPTVGFLVREKRQHVTRRKAVHALEEITHSGWVLGVKNPEISNTQPIVIESTTDESVDERTDTDES